MFGAVTTTVRSSNLVPFFVARSANSPPSSSLSWNNVNRFSPTTRYTYSNITFTRHSNLQFLIVPSAVESDSYNSNLQQQQQKEEALQAVSEILREYSGGALSNDDCYNVASNSPNYVQLLVDSVLELDELQISSNSNGDKSFKDKVYEMGQQKGDKGVAPFLESCFGLSVPSAMHLSRSYLSSHQTLPHLILKVKYLKEIFFSEASDDRIGEAARRMMIRLSISVDDDALQQTLSFFEKTQARRGGLSSLGSRDSSFHYLIQSFPRILLLPLETHLKPMVEFFEGIGVPNRCMRNVFLLYPPILFYDIDKDIKPVFVKVKAEYKDCGRILLKYPWILSSSIQKNYLEILSFFETKMVPKSCVHLAIKSWPRLLGCSIGKLKLMVKQFSDLGISNKKLGQVIAKSPQLLLQKPWEFQQVVFFFKELGLDEESVGRILQRCPEIFATDIDRILRRKIEFLCSIGISKSYLPRVIKKYPELFVCDVDKALHPRIMYLMEIGLSRRDVASMVGRFSPILGYSIKEVLRPKSEFLVNTMEKPMRDVVDYPRYFSYSMEKKIEPRYWELRNRNIECSLKDMLSKNDEEFAAEFMNVERIPGSVRQM